VIADTGDNRVRTVPSTQIIANLTGTGVRGDDPGELFSLAASPTIRSETCSLLIRRTIV